MRHDLLVIVTSQPTTYIMGEKALVTRLKTIRDDKSRSKEVSRMAGYLVDIIRYLDVQKWGEARIMLIEKPERFGYKVDVKPVPLSGNKTEDEKTIENESSNFWHFHKEKKLCYVDFVLGANPKKWPSSANNGWIAQRVLPLMLEEFIHMFQHAKKGYVCLDTTKFAESSIYKKNKGKSDWSLSEIDIYATFRQLGWKNLLGPCRDRYKGREAFEEWMQKNRR